MGGHVRNISEPTNSTLTNNLIWFIDGFFSGNELAETVSPGALSVVVNGVSGLHRGSYKKNIPNPVNLLIVNSLQGVMSQSINWELLETQYLSDGVYRDRLAKMVTVVDESFVAGQQFVKQYKQSMTELKHDIKDTAAEKPSMTKDEIAIDSMLQDAQLVKSSAIKCDKPSLQATASSQNGQIVATPSAVLPAPTSVYDTLWGAGSAITSAISDSSTKLMDLILPAAEEPETNIKNGMNGKNGHFGPIDTTIMNWWERDALQFMRGSHFYDSISNFDVEKRLTSFFWLGLVTRDDGWMYAPEELLSAVWHIVDH